MNKPLYRTMDSDLIKPLREFRAADIEDRKLKLALAMVTNGMRNRVHREAPTFAGDQYPIPDCHLPRGVYGRIKLSYLSKGLDYGKLKDLDPELYQQALCMTSNCNVYYTADIPSMPCDDEVDLLPLVSPWGERCGEASWPDLLRWHASLCALKRSAEHDRADARHRLDAAVHRTTRGADMHTRHDDLVLHRPGFTLTRARKYRRRIKSELYAQIWQDRPQLMWQIQKGIVRHPLTWGFPVVPEQTSWVFTNIDVPGIGSTTPNLIIGS